MSARLASSVWVSPAAARSALIRSAKAALRAGTIKFFCLPFATSIKVTTLPPIRSRQQNPGTAIYNWGSHYREQVAAVVIRLTITGARYRSRSQRPLASVVSGLALSSGGQGRVSRP